MLVLSRHINESIIIGDEIEVTIVDIKGDQIRVGIKAPKHIKVHRKEIYEAIKRENIDASKVKKEDMKNFESVLKNKFPPKDKKPTDGP